MTAFRGRLLPAALTLLGIMQPLPNLLAAAAAPNCSAGETYQSLSLSDWESGLGVWTVGTYSVADASTFDTPDWTTVGSLPDGRPGMAAFVPNLDIGDCALDDETGVLTLNSPAIVIPANALGAKISVIHWYLTEPGWDGGNLKVSVNGGPFQLIPASAFEAGTYPDMLFSPTDEFGVTYNTNPLADQQAFTGPEDFNASGWIESHVNLSGIAGPGDSIRIRFDFGIDACFGETGWYVDEVEVYSCSSQQNGGNPRLTLIKNVVNDNGGAAVPGDWTLTATGPTPFSGPGPTVSGGDALQPGSYVLSESVIEGYDAGDWQCTGGTQTDGATVQLQEGDDVTCTVTNNDRAPTLNLVKRVVNDNGGDATPGDWTLTANGPSFMSGRGPSVFNGANFQAGTYNLSESGGPAGYVASAWVCEGGTQLDRDTVVLDIGESAVCTITNDDTDTDFAINQGLAGGWFDEDTSGQGILLDIRPEDQYMFMAWFTYTDAESANPNEQRWLTAQGNYSGNIAVLELYEILGGRFDDPQEVSFDLIGEVSLRFSSCDVADMDFLIQTEDEELQGTIPLQRLIPGSGALCEQLSGTSTQAVDINDGMDGGWYEPETAGQGFLIDTRLDDESGNFIFVAWFTYGDDTASGLRWLTAQGGFEGSFAEIEITETTGGSFNDPLEPSFRPVGTMRVDFEDCSSATLTYALDDELEGEIPLQRLLPGNEALCEDLSSLE